MRFRGLIGMLIFFGPPLQAHGAAFTWKVRLLDKATREEKVFVLEDSKLELKIPGKFRCVATTVDKNKEADGSYTEIRNIACHEPGRESVAYTTTTCLTGSNGIKSPRQTSFIGLFDNKVELGLFLVCE